MGYTKRTEKLHKTKKLNRLNRRGTYHEYNGGDGNANGALRREKMRREGGLGAVVRENGRRERGVCEEWGRGKAVADLKGLLLLPTARPSVIIKPTGSKRIISFIHITDGQAVDGLAVGRGRVPMAVGNYHRYVALV
ncbi:hypothetical protein PIB30_082193 [Stylosanthes scabra]|uniref:Uncharacterized protein n=1 Tax=Stylosanthes scabra TaxID=79078 RepID=A0ABU6UQS1_9FABA|nr:hypothetical protein [Stylosanthes scabra]